MWTPEIVRARFVEAADTERRLPQRGGGGGGYWPAYVYSFEDMSGWGTKRLAEEREMRMKRIPPSAAAISRHEEVMQWTADRIPDERRRRIVWAWAWCRLNGTSFADRCRKQGWVKITAYRRLTAAFLSISRDLGNDGVLLRMPDEKWVIQETPVSATDSDMVGMGANAPPTSPTSIIFDGDRPRHLMTSPQAIEGFEKHLASVNRERRKGQGPRVAKSGSVVSA